VDRHRSRIRNRGRYRVVRVKEGGRHSILGGLVGVDVRGGEERRRKGRYGEGLSGGMRIDGASSGVEQGDHQFI
jgi:hypothetical protein